MITIYHGSNLAVLSPDPSHAKNYLDFGSGFYCTQYQEQAERWAVRKAIRTNQPAIVTIFDFNNTFEACDILNLLNDDAQWLDFVCECRAGSELWKQYDLIIGRVANDDVFKSIEFYRQGIWNREQTLSQLRYSKPNNQFCFTTQSIMNISLHYREHYHLKVSEDGTIKTKI